MNSLFQLGKQGAFSTCELRYLHMKGHQNSFNSRPILHAGGRTNLSETRHFGSGRDNLVLGSR